MDAALLKKRKYDDENRISYLQMYVNHCVGLAARSPDPSTKVGCVIFDKECRLLAQGFNGEITTGEVRSGRVDKNMKSFRDVIVDCVSKKQAKQTNCKVLQVCDNAACSIHISVKESILNASNVYTTAQKAWEDQQAQQAQEGENEAEAPQLAPVERPPLPTILEDVKSSKGADGAIHAEMNALLHARCGRDEFKGAIAIVSLMPCPQCFKLLAQSGIEYVIILSDSGRYLDTLRLVNSLGVGAPKIIPLNLIEQYIDAENCISTKVFKSKLVPFIIPPVKGSTTGALAKALQTAEILPEGFDYDYESIILRPSLDGESVNKLFDILFKNKNA